MCYAIPGKTTKIDGETAAVDFGGVKRTVNISLVSVKAGDYVLVHAGFAIQVLDRQSAEDSLRIIEKQIENEE